MRIILVFYGLFALLCQLLILRELSVLFYADELFLGTYLAAWLFWVGMGSLSIRHIIKHGEEYQQYLAISFLGLSLLLSAQILLIRLAKGIFFFARLIGPQATAGYISILIGPICLIVGAQFNLACLLIAKKNKDIALARVYLWETLGSVIGGVLFTYFLIGRFAIFSIILTLSLGSILISLFLFRKNLSAKILFFIFACVLSLFINLRIEGLVNRIQWRGYGLIRQVEARNENLSLVSLGSIKSVFIDGVITASFPNPEAYEPIAHWPLLLNNKAKDILVIGEANIGVIAEALKHNPDSIDYVLLDSAFIELIKPYLGRNDTLALKDKRLSIRYVDPRLYVKDARKQYDAIIINFPEVSNLKLNRFYTYEFFVQASAALRPGGIFALSIASSENYLSQNTQAFNASVYKTLGAVFSNIEIIPGDNMIMLASPSPIDMNEEAIISRLNSRKVSNIYAVDTYFKYELNSDRRAKFKKILAEKNNEVRINYDFYPAATYYFGGFWQNKFSSPISYLILGILLVAFIMFIFRKRKLIAQIGKEHIYIFIFGFIGIVLELILLLAFQVTCGFIYWQMGFLFAAFMLGLFLGSNLGAGAQKSAKEKLFLYSIALSSAIITLSLGLRFIFMQLVNLSNAANLIIVTMILIVIGIILGCVFVVVSFLKKGEEVMVKAGNLYSADLWGAAIGALLAGNFIIPYFGLFGALNACVTIGFIGLVILIVSKKNYSYQQ